MNWNYFFNFNFLTFLDLKNIHLVFLISFYLSIVNLSNNTQFTNTIGIKNIYSKVTLCQFQNLMNYSMKY